MSPTLDSLARHLTFALAALLCPVLAAAVSPPALSMVKAGTAATTSDAIPIGTASFSLDVKLNSGERPVSGTQFYVSRGGPGAVNYASMPYEILDNPFTPADVSSAPSGSAEVKESGGTFALFKGSAGDYPAVAGNAIVRVNLNTSSLAAATYTFTPVLTLFSNTDNTFENPADFGPAGSFTLTVTPVPEPAAVGLAGVATFIAARRRRARE